MSSDDKNNKDNNNYDIDQNRGFVIEALSSIQLHIAMVKSNFELKFLFETQYHGTYHHQSQKFITMHSF